MFIFNVFSRILPKLSFFVTAKDLFKFPGCPGGVGGVGGTSNFLEQIRWLHVRGPGAAMTDCEAHLHKLEICQKLLLEKDREFQDSNQKFLFEEKQHLDGGC